MIKTRIAWNKGIPCSEETKNKIGKANKGNVAWNKDIKGIHLSPESEFKEGDIPWNKGKSNPFPESTLIAMSKAKKGLHISRDTEFAKGFIPWNKDKKTDALSEDHKKKISNAMKLRSPEIIKKSLSKRTPSSLEDKFQKIIDKYDLPYKYVGNGKFFIERYNPDFVNTNHKKIAIEVYARYYKLRNNKSIEEWKKDRQEVFNEYGWKIIYFDEIEVNEKNVLEKIKKKGSDFKWQK